MMNGGEVSKPSVQANGTVQLRQSRRVVTRFFEALGVSRKKAAEKVVPESIYQAPTEIVASEELGQVSDVGAIDALVSEVIASQAKSAEDFKNGKDIVMKFLVGQVMKASRGKADPVLAEERLRAMIGAKN